MCSLNLLPPHHFLPSPTPHYGRLRRAHHKPINHPCGLDRHWRNGSVYVRSPTESRLHPHRLQPNALQGPAPHHLGAHLADSLCVVASQSVVVFSIVGYPSDVRSVVLDPTTNALFVLDPTTNALFGLCPGGVLVDMTTKNCSSIDASVTGGGDLNIPIYPGPLFQLPPNLSRSCLWSK